jgi:hypothetical protein
VNVLGFKESQRKHRFRQKGLSEVKSKTMCFTCLILNSISGDAKWLDALELGEEWWTVHRSAIKRVAAFEPEE